MQETNQAELQGEMLGRETLWPVQGRYYSWNQYQGGITYLGNLRAATV